MSTVTVSTIKALKKAMSSPEVETILVKSGQDVLSNVLKLDKAGQLVGGAPSRLLQLAANKPQTFKSANWTVVAVAGIAATVVLGSLAIFNHRRMAVKWKVLKIMEGEIVLEHDVNRKAAKP